MKNIKNWLKNQDINQKRSTGYRAKSPPGLQIVKNSQPGSIPRNERSQWRWIFCSQFFGHLSPTHPLDILTRAGIDHDDVPFLDEQRHLDFGAGFESGIFHQIGCRVAAHAGFGLGYFQL